MPLKYFGLFLAFIINRIIYISALIRPMPETGNGAGPPTAPAQIERKRSSVLRTCRDTTWWVQNVHRPTFGGTKDFRRRNVPGERELQKELTKSDPVFRR